MSFYEEEGMVNLSCIYQENPMDNKDKMIDNKVPDDWSFRPNVIRHGTEDWLRIVQNTNSIFYVAALNPLDIADVALQE